MTGKNQAEQPLEIEPVHVSSVGQNPTAIPPQPGEAPVGYPAWNGQPAQPYQPYYADPAQQPFQQAYEQTPFGQQPCGTTPGQGYQQTYADPAQQAYQQPPYGAQGYQQQYYQQPYPNPQGGLVPSSKSKVAAGVLAILLGALGIHKFYLGYNKQGVIMLLASILTFGLGASAMGIIGLVEGIIYLCLSDYEFYTTHVTGRKPWF